MAGRLSVQEAGQILTDALPANGAAVEYDTVLSQLESAGNGAAVMHLNTLKAEGKIQLSVVAGENGPVLQISRGGNA